MKISLQWAQQYSNVDLLAVGKEKLLQKIGAQLGAIEEVAEWGPRYDGIVVAKVITCEKHPNADKLHVCTVDDGGVTKDVRRNADGHIEVVCGAPNVKAGLTVAWLPPGVTVPSTIGKEPLVLEAREIRGVISNGMLASPKELGISDNHEGILEIDPAEVGEELTKPGTAFKQLYGLDDLVIDIENKMFTHRPDLFGILGNARELAGIQQLGFKSPDWYQTARQLELSSTDLELKVENQVPDLVPRFMVQVIENVTVQPSPMWLQAGLTRVGIRPINNLVDWSNFYMHLTAQPTHAFDYDKLKTLSGGTPTLGPRLAREGEELTLLGGKKIKLTAEDIVIATDKQPVALAGIMGGAETEVDEHTKTIAIECATFDMYAIRRSSMRHGLFTDATTRFTKGQSPWQNDRVLADLAGQLQKAGAEPTSLVIDHKADSLQPPASVTVTVGFINDRLGLTLGAEEMADLLRNVEFNVAVASEELTVTAPFWRTDIEMAEDVVEEVGRLYGYDHLPLVLPTRNIVPTAIDPVLTLKAELRQRLSRAGANEVLTYSFVHGDLLAKVGQDREQAYQLANALSPDLQYFRLSLTPSLLEKVHPNIKAGVNKFTLFELNKVHNKTVPDPDEPNVPKEVNVLSLAFAADDKTASRNYSGAPYFEARKYLEQLLNILPPNTIEFASLDEADLQSNPWLIQMFAPYEPTRSATLRSADGLIWGVVGEYKTSVRQAFKLPLFCAGFEVDPLLFWQASTTSRYQPLPRFPKVEQDICLRINAGMPYTQLYEVVEQSLRDNQPPHTQFSLLPIDIFQREDDTTHKQVTLRLSIASYERTLTDQEVSTLLSAVATDAKTKLAAERI